MANSLDDRVDTGLLFEPFNLAGCEIPNRIVMAPMTRFFTEDNGILAASAIDYYRRRAEGGIGLILTEGIATSDLAAQCAQVPKIEPGPGFDRWKMVVDAVHQQGTRIMAQLWHTGLGRVQATSRDPSVLSVGPMADYLPEGSPLIASGGNAGPGRAMTEADIAATIEEFAVAAERCQQAGFDGVQLHAAHGYLFDQFFWTETNRRTDGYGGDVIGRTRLAVEVIREIRRRVGPDFPIGLRYSQWKLPAHYGVKPCRTPEELESFLAPIVGAGVDFLDASTRRFWEPAFEGSPLTLAGWTRKLTGVPTMAVGSIGLSGAFVPYDEKEHAAPDVDIGRIAGMIQREEADMIMVGRALITNPDWANKVRDGRAAELVAYDIAALADHF
ncbi:MAG: 12-oxophytodienoate reductase [Alphaproteobacteria bacterium]|nr:12-oxophytodienoate reductase [Alphaproteobacteria bacterium]